jgi:hypothetical protein
MILYYAVGGGVGHITRALAILHTLNIRENVLIVSTVDGAFLKTVPHTVQFAKPTAAICRDAYKLSAYLQKIINEHQPNELIVDSYPLGVLGELNHITYCGPRTYLARLIKWDRYSKKVGNRLFIYQRTFVLEPLHQDHQFIVNRISELVLPLDLTDPPQHKPLPAIPDLEYHWLILHSGPEEEINDLINYAKQIRNIEHKHNPFLLVTPSTIDKWSQKQVIHKRLFPAHRLMPHVEKIITACGCNTMRQARQFRDKHHFFPFTRCFDDQYFRAVLYRENALDKNLQRPTTFDEQ